MNQLEGRKTAVAYVRVSSDEQAEGLSIESQEEEIREWCGRKDFDLAATFRDEGESAYTDDIAKRPGFRKLVDQLPALMPTVVVVFSLDRWARSLVVASESFRRMSALGIGFASVIESEFDLSNPASGFMLNMLASFAQYGSAMTAQHVRRVADLKFERGVHRGAVPFGYWADPQSTRAESRPPIPDEPEFSAVVELFQRALTGAYSCRDLASWLSRPGFKTRNRKKSVIEELENEGGKPRKFTSDSVQGILTNPFYAGFVVRQRRSKNGTPTSREVREGAHRPAVPPENFNRVQSILRARYKAPRSASNKLRPYLAKGLLRCMTCGEKAWCQHIKGWDYYRESSPFRGIACSRAGRYWPAPSIDHQIETLVKPMELPLSWQQRALELANAENSLIDLRSERLSLEARRRRVIELYKEGTIDRAEFDCEVQVINNRLRTTAPADGSLIELSIADFERFGENWDLATPEEKHQMLRCIFESMYVEFRAGQVVEVVPKPGFRWVLEGAEITKPPGSLPGDTSLVIGDPDGALDLMLRNMIRPLVVVRASSGQPGQEPDTRKVLVPLDTAAYSSHALPEAQRLAKALGASIVLCHVIAPVGPYLDPANAPPGVRRIIEELMEKAHSFLSGIARQLEREGATVETIVTMGEPPQQIVRVAERSQAGVIAMATRGTRNLSRIMGSVAYGVLQFSHLPSLLVRPTDTS